MAQSESRMNGGGKKEGKLKVISGCLVGSDFWLLKTVRSR